ncbi:MAG TPA: TIGR01777 family oxidoreductase [Marmoricola sp.]
MRILIAGSSGFLGTHLREHLVARGHEVVPLVRRAPGPGEVQWDPYAGRLDRAAVEAADVVVNLAGAPTLGNPHSKAWARDLRESRVTTTRVLAEAVAASERKPAFLAQNGVSGYGDHGAEPVTETAELRADSFLGEVARAWQQATEPAVEAGARVCVLRTAVVLDRRSAPLKQQLLQFRAAGGGRLGSGRQYYPVISTRDWVGAAAFLVDHPEVTGPVNLAAPQVPTNTEFTSALAARVHRPAMVHVPAAVLRVTAGRMAPEVLTSVRVVPQVLLDAGHEFADPDIGAMLDTALAAGD